MKVTNRHSMRKGDSVQQGPERSSWFQDIRELVSPSPSALSAGAQGESETRQVRNMKMHLPTREGTLLEGCSWLTVVCSQRAPAPLSAAAQHCVPSKCH